IPQLEQFGLPSLLALKHFSRLPNLSSFRTGYFYHDFRLFQTTVLPTPDFAAQITHLQLRHPTLEDLSQFVAHSPRLDFLHLFFFAYADMHFIMDSLNLLIPLRRLTHLKLSGKMELIMTL